MNCWEVQNLDVISSNLIFDCPTSNLTLADIGTLLYEGWIEGLSWYGSATDESGSKVELWVWLWCDEETGGWMLMAEARGHCYIDEHTYFTAYYAPPDDLAISLLPVETEDDCWIDPNKKTFYFAPSTEIEIELPFWMVSDENYRWRCYESVTVRLAFTMPL